MHVAIYANDCGMSQRAEVFYRALFVDILDDIRFNTRSSPALVEPAEMPDNALCKPRLSGRSASFAHERRSEQSAEEKSSKKSPSLRQQILRRRKNWNYALPVRYKVQNIDIDDIMYHHSCVPMSTWSRRGLLDLIMTRACDRPPSPSRARSTHNIGVSRAVGLA